MKKYISREISWLSFNDRVLQEAADPKVPLMERFKFLGIYSSNLDEFYSVRVGTLRRVIKEKIKVKAELGANPTALLNKIQKIVLEQRDKFDDIFTRLKKDLENQKIFIIDEMQLNQEQQEFVKTYLEQEVRPRLVPIMVNEHSPFPYLKNRIIYLAVYMIHRQVPVEKKFALIEVTADILPRFVKLPPIEDRKFIIMLDDIIRFGLRDIFAIFDFDDISAYTIKLTRDAEITIDDDVTISFFEKISKSIKQRKMGLPVRFVYDREMPEDLLEFILEKNNLKKFENLNPGGRYHNARDFVNFPNVGSSRLEYPKIQPLLHPNIGTYRSILQAIKDQDLLLHYPYQSFHHFIDLLREAAIDPNVISIKITLYRVAQKSNVVNSLINASQNGKSVTVVMELQARFDEEANIYWTKKLEEADIHLIDGVPGLKVHSKLCLITRMENGKKVHYGSVGTGNFNESTARVYSDHTLFTSDKRITGELVRVFEFLEKTYKSFSYKHLLVSPFYMRKRLLKMIKNETRNARAGKEAYIYLKLNSLVDQEMIKKLYRASQAGVKIRMIVRGICSLVPGIKDVSENIEVISIVDKYLEHSRILIFANDGDEKIYLSSADWMVRNLDNRVEVAVPVYHPEIQKEIKQFLEIQFQDTVKARIINQNQDNTYKKGTGTYQAQNDIYHSLDRKPGD